MANNSKEPMLITSLFFDGGVSEVKRILARAIQEARKQQGFTEEKFNELCYFREDGLPFCEDFEKNPELMNYRVFNRATCLLGLVANEILNLDVTGDKLTKVLSAMDDANGGLAAAYDTQTGDAKKGIPDHKVAPVYATFKILAEIGAGAD